MRLPYPVARIEELQADVGKRRVGAHLRALAVDRGMPGVERADRPHGAGVNVNADAPVLRSSHQTSGRPVRCETKNSHVIASSMHGR